MFKKILILLGILYHASADEPYRKVINTLDPDAICLDGTSPLLYFHKGYEASKFLIYFMGGGVC